MSKTPIYGFPCVSDPNNFEPDPDCATPEELATWQEACRTYGKPDHQLNKGCFSQYSDDGKLVLHVARTSWGLGVSLIPTCDGCEQPDFDGAGLMTCHECGGPEFCAECWPEHHKSGACAYGKDEAQS